MKRFQNQLRFRAMALAAQDAPGLDTAKIVGPVGRYLAAREQAKQEADQRSDKLLPEPILVGLETLRVVFPEIGVEQLRDRESTESAVGKLDSPRIELAVMEELDNAFVLHAREVENGRWLADCRWPPQDEQLRRYVESFDLGHRAAEGQSRTATET